MRKRTTAKAVKIDRGDLIIESTNCSGYRIAAEVIPRRFEPALVVFGYGAVRGHEARVARASKALTRDAIAFGRDTADLGDYMAGYNANDLLAMAKSRRSEAPVTDAEHAQRPGGDVRAEEVRLGRHWPYMVEQLAAEGVFPEQDDNRR